MTDHIHIYSRRGRCLHSRPFTGAANPHSVDRSESERLQWQLVDLGRRLTHWDPVNRVGLASGGTEDGEIVRLKPVALARDMQSAGVAHVLDQIRLGAVEVSYTGEMLAA